MYEPTMLECKAPLSYEHVWLTTIKNIVELKIHLHDRERVGKLLDSTQHIRYGKDGDRVRGQTCGRGTGYKEIQKSEMRYTCPASWG